MMAMRYGGRRVEEGVILINDGFSLSARSADAVEWFLFEQGKY